MPSHPILPIYFLFVETLSINLRKNNISKNGNFPLFSLLKINCQKWANYRLQNGQMWFFYIGTIKSDLYQGIKVKINDMTSNNYCCLMVYCAVGWKNLAGMFYTVMHFQRMVMHVIRFIRRSWSFSTSVPMLNEFEVE